MYGSFQLALPWQLAMYAAVSLILMHELREGACFQDMKKANRIFYLSIPPSIFTAVAGCASKAASSPTGWTRVIVEKPFGKDSESFAQLERELSNFLSEEQMYRIDHYLGKELIENLTVCANSHITMSAFSVWVVRRKGAVHHQSTAHRPSIDYT